MSCGLILVNVQLEETHPMPLRRAEDGAVRKRRAHDREVYPCKFCGSEIPAKAVRCRYCSEIVNDEFYRQRSTRLRARVNYASWIAYLFGLAALLVFRPVGIVSIAAGLLLSIAYYAIPVDPPPLSGSKDKTSFLSRLKRQLRLERVAVPIPHLRNKKLILVGTPLFAALIGYSANLFLLQEPMNNVLKQSTAFNGMDVSAHYKYWVVPSVVEYDLQSLTVRQTPMDVHTALLEFAKRVRNKRFSRIDIAYHGTAKFSVDGASFQRLGDEYAKRNFDYALYTFPRTAHPVGMSRPAPAALGDADALLQFHKQWYGDDPMTRPIAAH
jgi:predicted nucleic acid-binding Zn ribbon protein